MENFFDPEQNCQTINDITEINYQCKNCNQTFLNINDFIDHMKTHTEKKHSSAAIVKNVSQKNVFLRDI